MSATYEPGQVAVATVRGVPNVRVMRYTGVSGDWFSESAIGGAWTHLDSEVADVRPLVVLDIPDEHVEFVVDILLQPRHVWTNDVAAQIEAQTKPPPIPEPGLWGVVKTEDGEFVNVGPGWLSVEYGGLVHQWPTLRSPVLIREGVES